MPVRPSRLACRAAAAGRGARMSDTIRVLVADDQALVREGLMTLLQTADGIEPVACAGDGLAAVTHTATTDLTWC